MTTELFIQLEEKVTNAVETIELLRLQIEELEEENLALKAEHEKWRSDLTDLIGRLDKVDLRNEDQSESHLEYEDAELTPEQAEEEDFISA